MDSSDWWKRLDMVWLAVTLNSHRNDLKTEVDKTAKEY